MADPTILAEEVAALRVDDKVPPAKDDEDFVDPWNVESKSDAGVDYDKLISKCR